MKIIIFIAMNFTDHTHFNEYLHSLTNCTLRFCDDLRGEPDDLTLKVIDKQRTGTGAIKRQIPLLKPKQEINKYYK